MEMTSYAPGMFCWTDLNTKDAAGAKAFYGALLGWQMDDMPAGPGMIYTMCKVRGKDVAALSQMSPEMAASGMPSMWNSYIAVANVDEAQKKAEAAGARVMMPAFDVMDAGRMCMIQDPTGAMVALWQAKRHIGASLVYEPGSSCWFELLTRDPAKAKAFYTSVFGWTALDQDMGPMGTYTVFKMGETMVAGMMQMPGAVPAEVPSYWGVYFAVEDCDASAKKAQELGATMMMPPMDIPKTGRFTTLMDPQGGAFSIIKLLPM